MKCRNILAVAVAAASMQSYGLSTTNEACRIAVNSATTNTIIGLAAVNFGIGDNATEYVNPTNYVLTANLQIGDSLKELRKINGTNTWHTWTVKDAGGGVLYWEKDNDPNVGLAVVYNNDPTNSLRYGDALILERNNPAVSTPFYLVGQCPMTNMYCTVGSGESKLLANLSFSEVNLTNLVWTAGHEPADGDVIEVLKDSGMGLDSYFRYTDAADGAHKWGEYIYRIGELPENVFGTDRDGKPYTYKKVIGTNAVTDVTFQPGTGFWYQNNSQSNTPTLQW